MAAQEPNESSPKIGHGTSHGCRGPFIHRFRTERCFYIYDVNTNRIVQTDQAMYDLAGLDNGRSSIDELKVTLKHDEDEVEAAAERYQHMRSEHGLFSCGRPKGLKAFSPDKETLRLYDAEMQQLILETTQNCNLRCNYCAFSDYYPINRGYTNKSMSFETARKAIDFFLEHTAEADSHAVSFYGGEPLLEIDLIAQCVQYARDNAGSLKLRFSLTTNGTLITDAVLEKMIELDLHLLVSVDGPPHCHDANRVFDTGKGSALRVIDVLRKIKKKDKKYYESNIGFTTVIATNTDPVDYYMYFKEEDELMGRGTLMANFVDDSNTEYWCANPPTDNWRESLAALRWKYYESLTQGTLPKDRFLQGLFEDPFLKIYKRGIFEHVPRIANLNGCCTPGIRRLYVDCDGRFHMCERINQTLPIGNVDSGFDFQRIEEIVEEYRRVSEDKCCDCWLVRFCTMCFARAVGNACFTAESKDQQCESLRDAFHKDLTDYCEVAEINPAAFNYMEDIVVK